MRIRKPDDITKLPPDEAAAVIQKNWAGRALWSHDLQQIYGISPDFSGRVLRALKARGAIESYRDHGEGIATYRIRGIEE